MMVLEYMAVGTTNKHVRFLSLLSPLGSLMAVSGTCVRLAQEHEARWAVTFLHDCKYKCCACTTICCIHEVVPCRVGI